MLHPRYGNYLSCLYHMWSEEGIKGFYRGYLPHMLATGICLTIVPFMADQMLQRSNLYGRGKTDTNESLQEEVSERKERIERLRAKQK